MEVTLLDPQMKLTRLQLRVTSFPESAVRSQSCPFGSLARLSPSVPFEVLLCAVDKYAFASAGSCSVIHKESP